MRILVTGAAGFIGRALVEELVRQGHQIRAVVRHSSRYDLAHCFVDYVSIGDIGRYDNWPLLLKDIDAVVHCAAIAHTSGVSEADYEQINCAATIKLAHAAVEAGIARFVFLSSIRAQTGAISEQILTQTTLPNPTDAYGRSKLSAEMALAETGLDWVALRPVLVYGAGVKGNMATLLKLAKLPIPLPFKALKARRSLLALENLASAVVHVLNYPRPLRRPLIVADDEAVSVSEIISVLREGLGRSQRVFYLPSSLFKVAAFLTGRSALYERINGQLIAENRELKALGWRPSLTTEDGLRRLALSHAKPS